ncbi:MAG: outer membrane lipid asymmetry maintenance protein MlaD [Gammaproteobacteria bacterium]|nr:outer membrane lipid asymmetry maintenance protein MlaD [Pseudomonadota bacterium]MCH9662467.1 outer membrane lipid asymmetry maintenance protein MlaD [Gammaproteobacteria bacterium]
MSSFKQEFWVGIFVLAGVLSLFFASFQVSGMADLFSRPGYEVYAKFDNIGSLRPRAAVSASGVLVGRVASIGYDAQDYKAQVKLTIDNNYQFPSDSLVSIHTSGLLGEQYLHIEPGAEDSYLLAGDFFYNTESAIVLENLVSTIMGAIVDK